MKSSSDLFPVRLISAEVLGDLAEDVYLIKPNNSPDKSVEIALSHITPYEHGGESALQTGHLPIILLHSNHQNRHQWMSPTGDGFAAQLLSMGLDVWLMETRGHGVSPVNLQYGTNSLSEYARYDLPAVNAFVLEQTGRNPLWMGSREGGAALALSLAGGQLSSDTVSGMVFLDYLYPPVNGLLSPFISRGISGFSRAERFRPEVGPEPEPISIYREMWRDQGIFGYMGKSAGVDVVKQLSQITVPMVLVQRQNVEPENGLAQLLASSTVSLFPVTEGTSLPGSDNDRLTNNDCPLDLDALLTPWLHGEGETDDLLSAGEATPAV